MLRAGIQSCNTRASVTLFLHGHLADLLPICDELRLHQNTPVSDLTDELKGSKD